MIKEIGLNNRISSKIEIKYPDYSKLPERVKEKFGSLSTKVNFFRMLGIAQVLTWKS